MSTKKFLRVSVIGLILLSLVVSLYLDLQRVKNENDNRKVNLLLDYDEVRSIALANELALESLLRQYGQAGATGVLVRERTVEDLQRQGIAVVKSGSELALLKASYPELMPKLVPQEELTYLMFTDEENYSYVLEQLELKKKNVQGQKEGELWLIALPLTEKEFIKLGVGFPLQDLQALEVSGLSCVPRIRDWGEVTGEGLELLERTLEKLPNLSLVTFNDENITGANNLPGLAQIMEDLGVPVASFEFFNQAGLYKMATLKDKNLVRAHAISENEMMKVTPEQVLDRYKLAVSERNIRVLYVRLFGLANPDRVLDSTIEFISAVKSGVESEGYQLGTAESYGSLPSSRILLVLMGLGILAAGLLLLSWYLPEGWVLILGFLGLVGWLGLCYLFPQLARKGGALLAVIIFPLLGVLPALKEEKRSLTQAILQLLRISLISLAGAVIMTGLLADKSFMLKMDGFSGVKLAHVLPIVLVFLALWLGQEQAGAKLRKALATPVTYLYAAIGLFILAALAIYIIRTGNDGTMLVSSLETNLRQMMDNLLGVRPRTKEFLVGHPLMLVLLYYGYRLEIKRSVLLLFGLIGQVSLVNTYAHIHTPLLVSVTRSVHGLWIGIILGVIIILLLNLLLRKMDQEVKS